MGLSRLGATSQDVVGRFVGTGSETRTRPKSHPISWLMWNSSETGL